MSAPDVSHLSPRALAALASIGSADDLQLRTTIRHAGVEVEVLTSWLPVSQIYESMLKAPSAVLLAMRTQHLAVSVAYATRAAADAGHTALCTRMTEVLRGLPGDER